MKKSILLIGFVLLFTGLNAQYYQFSQYNYANQRTNPASISLSDYATVGFIYRIQDTSPDLNMNTFLFSAKYPLMTKNGGKRWSSVGLSAGKDQSGLSGILMANELGLTYALNFFLNKDQVLSFGTKLNYHSRKIDTRGLTTGTQFIPGIGFVSGGDLGEDFNKFNTDFFSFSGGAFWNKEDRKGRRIAHFGVSLFDINAPNESLLGGHSSMIPTFVIEGGRQIYGDRQFSIYPEFLYTNSASTSSLNIGAVTRYSFDHWNIKTVASAVELHTKYLLKEGVMFGLQLVNEGFSIGLSYDLPLHNAVAQQGAFEIGVELSKLIERRYRRTKRKKKVVRRKKTRKGNSKTKQDTNDKRFSEKNKEEEKKQSADKRREQMTRPEESKIEQQKERREEIKTTTSVGDLKHEALLLETTKLVYYFDFDSSVAEQETKDYISDLVKILKEDLYIRIKIIGHTDNVGTEAYNLRLSQRRAREIKSQLIENNISAERIFWDGRGESEPLAGNETVEGRRKNRRVEIILFY
ncbi:PorP/SprF family type IX secretion system membrane protein [Xanthovirga aplysinae]|uniref:PorP/SprF family type IX secretion system membrane protein n=1 Tax=Xanthovirga aplysinae TaxID=2529853 RepID=UPI0012BD2422|nr:PorP/SprF family type IX secretion system membrane protein [Xanthovirga aplysinae]MTI31023.1 type IX secretion system membrane protein PorP/SprF [Xanthovirga aplysinae]